MSLDQALQDHCFAFPVKEKSRRVELFKQLLAILKVLVEFDKLI
jgi:hypothetical protein